MAILERQAVRAEINIGNRLTVGTPDVLSFSVSKQRGQMTATFSASIKVPYTFLETASEVLADSIVISAGLKGNLKTIFTGRIYKCVVNPIRTDASKVMLNISGSDVLSILEGQHVNRRVTTWRDGDRPPERWGVVNNIVKEHTPLARRFPTRLYTPNNVAVFNIKGNHLITTPDAFSSKKSPERTGTRKITDGISFEKVATEETR